MSPERRAEGAAFGLRVSCDFHAPGVAEAPVSSAAAGRMLTVTRSPVEPAPPSQPVVETPLGEGSFQIRRGSGDAALHFDHPYFGRYELDGDRSVLRCDPAALAPWQWQRFLVGQLLPVAALTHGLGPMHCAAVVIGSEATLLVGTSGSGKTSTLLHLLDQGAALLADDVAALELGPRGVVAHPGSALCNVAIERTGILPAGARVLGEVEGEARVLVPGLHPRPVEVGAVWVLVRTREVDVIEVHDSPGEGSWSSTLLGTHFSPALVSGADMETWLQSVSAMAARGSLRVVRSPVDGDPAAVAATILAS